jgi:catalase-peroxidase
VNGGSELTEALQALDRVRQDWGSGRSDGKQVSLADIIVLGGCAAVE